MSTSIANLARKNRSTLLMTAVSLLFLCPQLPTLANSKAKANDTISIVPCPKFLELRDGELEIGSRSRIIAKDSNLKGLAKILSDEMFAVSGLRLEVDSGRARSGDIVLALDKSMDEEGYELQVDEHVSLRGGSYRAVAMGTVTFMQALSSGDTSAKLPKLLIRDLPDTKYRGLMIDLARQYHTIDGIEQVIQLCRLYKINYLQLHLTDDHLFMFPSSAFPNAGASNSEFTRFSPPSKTPPIRPYTREEMLHLERYSQARGVTIIPEIDLPGHSGRLIKDVPDPFRASKRNGNAINFASEAGLRGAATLLNELMDIFESTPYIHLGGDEVWLGYLDQEEAFKKAIAEDPNADSVHDLFRRFIFRMNAVVRARGKRMIVWEEAFTPNTDHPYALPKDAIILVWCLRNSPQSMIDRGYEVINGGWKPLYLVRDDKRSPEFIYDWKQEQFGRQRQQGWTTIEPSELQLGAQMLSWENSECFEIQSLRHRLPAMGERLWNVDANRTFEDFMARIENTDAILDKLVHPVSIECEGEFGKDENSFVPPLNIELSSDRKDLAIRYTLNNRIPDAGSKLYFGPFQVEKATFLRAAQFDSQGNRQGYMSGAWFRPVVKFVRNLATGKPVTATNTEHNADPQLAVDGQLERDGHWAGGTPSSLTVDLEGVYSIDRIELITYFDGSRFYQYKIEVSTDGENWVLVDDASENTGVAAASGYQSHFDAVEARYVRVHMLRNSANRGTHIVELMVHEAD